MKNRLTSLLAIGIVASVALVASVPETQAQTATTATNTTATDTGSVTNIPNFFTTALTWVSTFNISLTWTNTAFQLEDGMINQNGTGAADYIWAQYDYGSFEIIATGSFYGTGSAFTSAEGGVGYAVLRHYDLQISADLLAGGSKVNSTSDTMKFRVDPLVKLDKKITSNTYATIWLGVPWQQGKTFDGTPEFGVGLGATF